MRNTTNEQNSTVQRYQSNNITSRGNMQDFLNNALPLLYCVIFLLGVITILLIIILLRKCCKLRKENANSNIEGGIFRMSDDKGNSDKENSISDIANDSNKIQIYTDSGDDSSSTSSESSCDSYGNGKDSVSDSNQQYMTTIQTADYENILEGKSTSGLEIKSKPAKKNRDYVNIEEQQNMPLTKGRRSKTEKHQIDQDESQTSSASSSDESDEDSVNYSKVVFTKNTNAVPVEN